MVGLTNTSFGLLIAYLLSGLAGLIALSYWSRYLRELLKTFLEVESSVGLFLLVLLLSLIVGLQVTIVRSVIFEVLVPRLSRQERPPRVGYQALKDADTFAAFSGAIDAYYRYHQF